MSDKLVYNPKLHRELEGVPSEKKEPLISKKVKELFKNARVVTLKQLELFMPFIVNPEDIEQFWTGIDSEEQGMLDFLDTNGFEIIPCYHKGEQLLSEIYVNFDKFKKVLAKSNFEFYVDVNDKLFRKIVLRKLANEMNLNWEKEESTK